MDNTLIRYCKMYLGLKPYNNACNIVQGDGYFYYNICKKYGVEQVRATMKQLQEEASNEGLNEKPNL